MIVREFKLKTDKGTFSLNVKGERFLSNPSGLGISRTNTYAKVGNDYVVAKSEMAQGKMSCEMIFDDYDDYNSFMTYCLLNGKTTLIYQLPNSNTEYMRDVSVVDCNKGEKDGGKLKCSTTLAFLSNWYTYNDYTGTTDSNGECTLSVRNNGHIPCGFILEIDCESGATGTIADFDVTDIYIGEDTLNYPFDTMEGSSSADGWVYYLDTIDTELNCTYKKTDGTIGEPMYSTIQYFYVKVNDYMATSSNVEFKIKIRNNSVGSQMPIANVSLRLKEEYWFV